MTLTYKQEPKKYNPTIRLKRIEQRFNTGYRNIRRFKEDILNHLTTRVATKRVLNMPLKPMKIHEKRRVFPAKKWNVLMPRSQQFGKASGLIMKQQHPSIVFRRFFAYEYKNILNVSSLDSRNLFQNIDSSKRVPFNKKQDPFYLSFLTVAVRSFSLPFHFLMKIKQQNILQNNFVVRRAAIMDLFNIKLRRLNNVIQKIDTVSLLRLQKVQTKLQTNKQISPTIKKDFLVQLELFKKQLSKLKYRIIKRVQSIQFKQERKFNKEVLAFRYGRLSRKLPNKLFNSTQNQMIFSQSLRKLRITPYNLVKKHMFRFQCKPNNLIQIKRSTILPSNVFNFTTRSHGVLYRYMMILREKFGIWRYDIPFRIDTYLTAYEKRKRPTWFKTMCLSRGKIRLFYGQLTQRKTARLIKQTKAGFRGMFGIMERRLDVILVRINFCKNIFTAQHLVRHGHILVNFKLVTNCFYSIRAYDVVTFKKRELEKLYKYMIFLKLKLNRFKFPMVPYLVINYEYMYFYVKPISDARKSVGFTAPLSHGFLAKF
jgi:ribosomal 50S subunit-recycling heat shock protein